MPITTPCGGIQISEGATSRLENLLTVGSGVVSMRGRCGSATMWRNVALATADPLHVINLPATYT